MAGTKAAGRRHHHAGELQPASINFYSEAVKHQDIWNSSALLKGAGLANSLGRRPSSEKAADITNVIAKMLKPACWHMQPLPSNAGNENQCTQSLEVSEPSLTGDAVARATVAACLNVPCSDLLSTTQSAHDTSAVCQALTPRDGCTPWLQVFEQEPY